MKSAWADGSNAAVQVAQCVIIVSLKSQKEIQRAAQLLCEALVEVIMQVLKQRKMVRYAINISRNQT